MDKQSLNNYKPLPQIPFGRHSSVTNSHINSFYDMVSQVASTLKSYNPLGDSDNFFHQTAYVGFKDLSLAASTCSPISYEVSDDSTHYFIVPFHGHASCLINKKEYISSPSDGAMIIPGEARKGATTDLSMIQATLNSKRLISTAKTMIGDAAIKELDDRFLKPSLLNLKQPNLRLDRVFTRLCNIIDDCNLDSKTLELLGFDDIFYRAVVTSLFPEYLVRDAVSKKSNKVSIDEVCEYIDANLTETIYLTELEQFSQLSARSLQYAFLRRFGCTPTTWIRLRRLGLAHQLLMNPKPTDTVTTIAMECGFSSPSDFSRLYIKHYGISPKITLTNSQR